MTALALGIVALASLVVLCGVALPAAPFAWYFGSRALREIDDSGGTLGGRDEARAGQIMGIIGTALLGFGLMVILAVIVAASV